MSTDIKLTQAQDLSIVNGDIELITEGAEVTQSAKIRILHILGEWVFDYTLGVDWFGIMFSTESSYLQKKAELQRAIAKTPNLRRLLSFDFAVDNIERAGQVDFEADTIYGPISTDLLVG